MHPTETLSKILNIREKEKKDAQHAHHESIVYFEKIATKLYTFLNKKENAEELYEKDFAKLTSIDKIREQTTYIESLNQQIISMQEQVNKARSEMEVKQLKLTDAHVEVKKYEKIIEFRKHEQLMAAHRAERSEERRVGKESRCQRRGDEEEEKREEKIRSSNNKTKR